MVLGIRTGSVHLSSSPLFGMPMSETPLLHGIVEPELLVATCLRDGSIVYRNDAWKQILGNKENLWGSLIEGDQETAEQNFKEACRGSLVTHALFMASRPNRDIPAPVLLHFIPVSDSSHTTDAGSNFVTITGEMLVEPESWTESQTDRHRMETLGRMTMGITHDFNNLLGGILGHIAIMESEGILESAPPVIAEHINTIEKAAEDGAALINKIQRYIRQEKKAVFEPVELSGLIHDCVVLTKPYWFNEPRRQGIDIDVLFKPTEELRVLGSAAEIRDVLVNLLLNAVQAMPDGGQISITAKSADGNGIITVSDTGTGMTEDVRSRIFEPLFTTKTGRGSGMGLPVALGIIHEHDGSITVTSEWRSGTTFEITLPLIEVPDTGPDRVSARSENRQVSVLVVDDEEMVRKVISRLLINRGHQVFVTSSAGEALDALSDSAFDIIFSDQGMPSMNGREFARIVRSRYGNLPFVLLTGDTDITADPALIDRVISKPFKIEELDSAIQELT